MLLFQRTLIGKSGGLTFSLARLLTISITCYLDINLISEIHLVGCLKMMDILLSYDESKRIINAGNLS